MVKSRLFLSFFVVSTAIGFLWVGYAQLCTHLKLSFSNSGWLTAVWFLPALLAFHYQRQKNTFIPGLIFFSETCAAMISASFSVFSWTSLHFGMCQGVAGELAFAVRKNHILFLAALASADVLLMGWHPHLRYFTIYNPWQWLAHITGIVLSTYVLSLVIRQWISKRHLWLMVLFFLAPHADACIPIPEWFRKLLPVAKEIVIGSDVDGTIVNTDAFLSTSVIPETIWAIAKHLYPDQIEQWIRLRTFLKENPQDLPPSFTAQAWAEHYWPFSIDSLPRNLSQRLGYDPHLLPLEAFWKKMTEIFEQRILLGFRPSVISPVATLLYNAYRYQKTKLVFITARRPLLEIPTRNHLSDILHVPFGIHFGNKLLQSSAHERAKNKVETIRKLPNLDVYLDNDKTYLETIRAKFLSLPLLLVQWEPRTGSHELRIFP